jgi:hypothetical protein
MSAGELLPCCPRDAAGWSHNVHAAARHHRIAMSMIKGLHGQGRKRSGLAPSTRATTASGNAVACWMRCHEWLVIIIHACTNDTPAQPSPGAVAGNKWALARPWSLRSVGACSDLEHSDIVRARTQPRLVSRARPTSAAQPSGVQPSGVPLRCARGPCAAMRPHSFAEPQRPRLHGERSHSARRGR